MRVYGDPTYPHCVHLQAAGTILELSTYWKNGSFQLVNEKSVGVCGMVIWRR